MALLLTAAVACEKKAPPPRSTPVVAVAKAMRGPLPYVVNAPGQVEPARTVSVQSQVSGMLTRVAFEEGSDVTQGQILFEVDSRPFRAELARVNSTLARDSANYAQAMLTVDRYAALAKTGAASREQMDQLNATAAALAGTLAADRASVDAAKLAVEQSVIRAPMSGRAGLLSIRAGNLVRASSEPPLVTINEVRPVMVKFAIPERDFAEMRKRAGTGKALDVMVRPSTNADSSKAIVGKLAVVDNAIDQSTGAITLKARVANQDGALWPGQFVKLELELSVDSNAITVPTQAVVTAQTGQFIYVLDGENKAKRHPVKVGRTTGLLSVIDSGLVGGETVITDGQTRLNDGAKVEIRTLNGRSGGRGDANKTRAVSDSAGDKTRSGNDSTGSATRGDSSGGRGQGRGRGGN
ncbi:MAG: efflux RND transporter periplasmic adaptor subunit [Gemmatimonadaceae bacterium]